MTFADLMRPFAHAVKPRGTEDAPIVIRTDGSPMKYQCLGCRLWFVEAWERANFRDLEEGVYRCQRCHDKARRKEWAKLAGEQSAEWEKYGA